ncbi:site-2 protease family protein [Clostridium sp. SM-530-WT-3G]|uniref:site-2 protease family protein n=1 Tax=Clostridium sp. SM-530-WT-3G TaxID=2725303 RepID=UPI00145F1AB3|nr:site-2 protease family protein [Clostridium sp. SM-530-WT-3G]NME82428.1 site-2 protease family protein [Clostridium sp. SM-530-WT-3G]
MDYLLNIILMIPGMLIAFTFHEYAHALMADRLGDKTPRFQGRLTLNPLVHIDPLGFLAVIFFRFGWAKPVQTNPSAYKNYYKDDLKVSLAGPVMNFLVAIVLSIILGVYVGGIYKYLPRSLSGVLYSMLFLAISININIGIFNLIPIPGLDGFNVLRDALPDVFYKYQAKFYEYQMIILVIFVVAGSRIISIPSNGLLNIMMKIASAFAGLF